MPSKQWVARSSRARDASFKSGPFRSGSSSESQMGVERTQGIIVNDKMSKEIIDKVAGHDTSQAFQNAGISF